MRTTSPLHDNLMAAAYRRVRLFTTIGIYEGRLLIHPMDEENPARGIKRLELSNYTMPGQEGLRGDGVIFDPEIIKGIHPLGDGPALNL